MRVKDGARGGGVLFRRQEFAEFRLLARPPLLSFTERLLESAPSDVAGERGLFGGRSCARFRFQRAQETDGFDVSAITLFGREAVEV